MVGPVYCTVVQWQIVRWYSDKFYSGTLTNCTVVQWQIVRWYSDKLCGGTVTNCTAVQWQIYGLNNRGAMDELLSFLTSFLVNSECRFCKQTGLLCTTAFFSWQSTHGPAISKFLIACSIHYTEHTLFNVTRTTGVQWETVSLWARFFSRSVWPLGECVQSIILEG